MRQKKNDAGELINTRTESERQEKDIRAMLLADKIPFVFESDKKLIRELALDNSYIRSLFKL